MWFKETLKYAVGFALAGALLWWVLRGTDPQILWGHLREASWAGLALGALVGVAHNIPRVLRWRALLEPVRPGVPFRPMFDAVILGYATSWVIPGRLGELVRPALLSGRERLPLGPCLGSVLADRVFDGMAVVVLFLVGALWTPLSGEAARHAALIRAGAVGLVAVILIPIVVLLFASRARGRLEPWLSGHAGWRGWLGRTVLALAQGVDALRRPRLLARIVFHTMAAWLLIALATWIGIRSAGADVSFGAILMILPLLVLGIALPTPGGAGGYHAAMRVGLIQLFGVEESLAVGAGLLQHAAVVLPVIVLGAALLVVDRIPIHDLFHAARQLREMGASPSGASAPTHPAEKTP